MKIGYSDGVKLKKDHRAALEGKVNAGGCKRDIVAIGRSVVQ